MYAVQEVTIPELLNTRRPIVTNLPLRMDRLNEFLQQKYPDLNIACHHRITTLRDDQLSSFYDVRPDGSENGVCYIIDEAQIPFNARDWASAPKKTFAYLTQHRHRGDDVWAITQAPGNLDKQFRSLAQDFRRMRNERLIQLGAFRGFSQFRCQHFDTEPSGKGEPYKTEKFQFDFKGIASCYDTSGGIGLTGGNKADIGARAKGLTVGWGAAGLFLLASLVFIVPWVLGKATEKYLGKGVEKAVASKATPASSPGAMPTQTTEKTPQSGESSTPSRRLLGVTVRGQSVRVIWSDGIVTTERDKRLQSIESGLVVYDGSAYPLWSQTQSPPPKEKEQPIAEPVAVNISQVTDDSSEWKTDKDGVQRLKNPPTLSTIAKSSFNQSR